MPVVLTLYLNRTVRVSGMAKQNSLKLHNVTHLKTHILVTNLLQVALKNLTPPIKSGKQKSLSMKINLSTLNILGTTTNMLGVYLQVGNH